MDRQNKESEVAGASRGGGDHPPGASRVAADYRGSRMLHQWEDAGEVCSLYEFKVETPAGAKVVVVSEWNTVRDGQVASSLMVFDTGALRARRANA